MFWRKRLYVGKKVLSSKNSLFFRPTNHPINPPGLDQSFTIGQFSFPKHFVINDRMMIVKAVADCSYNLFSEFSFKDFRPVFFLRRSIDFFSFHRISLRISLMLLLC
jgi:hypothetical protein